MFKICLGNRKNVYLLKMKIGQGQNLYSHLVLRFTFFLHHNQKWSHWEGAEGRGAGDEKGAQKKKDKNAGKE